MRGSTKSCKPARCWNWAGGFHDTRFRLAGKGRSARGLYCAVSRLSSENRLLDFVFPVWRMRLLEGWRLSCGSAFFQSAKCSLDPNRRVSAVPQKAMNRSCEIGRSEEARCNLRPVETADEDALHKDVTIHGCHHVGLCGFGTENQLSSHPGQKVQTCSDGKDRQRRRPCPCIRLSCLYSDPESSHRGVLLAPSFQPPPVLRSDLRSTISSCSPFAGDWESIIPGCYSAPTLNDVTNILYEFIFMVRLATTSSFSDLRIM